jgi:hypothetical protein
VLPGQTESSENAIATASHKGVLDIESTSVKIGRAATTSVTQNEISLGLSPTQQNKDDIAGKSQGRVLSEMP